MASPQVNVASPSLASLPASGLVVTAPRASSPDAAVVTIEDGSLSLQSLFAQYQILLTGEAPAEHGDGAGPSGSWIEKAPVRGNGSEAAGNPESTKALAAALQIHVRTSAPTKISMGNASPASLIETFPALARAAALLAAPTKPAAPQSTDVAEATQSSAEPVAKANLNVLTAIGASVTPHSDVQGGALMRAFKGLLESELSTPASAAAPPSDSKKMLRSLGMAPTSAGAIALRSQLSQTSSSKAGEEPTDVARIAVRTASETAPQLQRAPQGKGEGGESPLDAPHSASLSLTGAVSHTVSEPALDGPVMQPSAPSQGRAGGQTAGPVTSPALPFSHGPQLTASEHVAPVRGEIALHAQLSPSSPRESDGKPPSPDVVPADRVPRSHKSSVRSPQSESGQPPAVAVRPLAANSGSPVASDAVPPSPIVSSPEPTGLATSSAAPSNPAPRPLPQPAAVADADLQLTDRSQAPVRQINIPLRTEGMASAQVILTERGGQVGVTVRSGDPAVVEALRGQVQQLTAGLGSQGYQVRYWTPPTATSPQGEAYGGSDSSNAELQRQLEDHQPQPDPDSRRPSRADWDELFEENRP